MVDWIQFHLLYDDAKNEVQLLKSVINLMCDELLCQFKLEVVMTEFHCFLPYILESMIKMIITMKKPACFNIFSERESSFTYHFHECVMDIRIFQIDMSHVNMSANIHLWFQEHSDILQDCTSWYVWQISWS